MNENKEPPGKMTEYRSFILRLWRENPGQAAGWQASLQDAQTGRSYGFANLEELFAFLMDLGTFPRRPDAELQKNLLEQSSHGNGAKEKQDEAV